MEGEGTSTRTPREEEGRSQGPGMEHVCRGLTWEGLSLDRRKAGGSGAMLREKGWTPARGR